MRYSLEPHYRRYVQGQGFMSFALSFKSIINSKNAKNIFDVNNSMKTKYGKKNIR